MGTQQEKKIVVCECACLVLLRDTKSWGGVRKTESLEPQQDLHYAFSANNVEEMLLCLDSLNDTTLKAYDDIVIWA